LIVVIAAIAFRTLSSMCSLKHVPVVVIVIPRYLKELTHLIGAHFVAA
jgi:hypothetical protein